MSLRNTRRRRGANAMEFALIAPVLILVVSGVIDYGWYFFSNQTLNAAALDATRTASLTAWEANPANTAETEVLEILDGSVLYPENTEVVASYSGSPPDTKVTVEAKAEYGVLLGLLPMPEVVATAHTMVLEDQPTIDEFKDVTGDGDDD